MRRPVMSVHGPCRSSKTGLIAIVGILTLALLTQLVQAISPMAGLPRAHADTVASPPTPPKSLTLPTTPVVPGASKTGYLPGSWAVESNGAFGYTIPLDVPRGRADVAPH